MVLYLSKVEYNNDFYTVDLPNGSILSINKVQECFLVSGAEIAIDTLLLEVTDLEGNVLPCPTVIGMGNDILGIETDYTMYEGQRLTEVNSVFCTVHIYE